MLIGSLTNDSHERGSHLIRDLLRLSSKGLAKQVDREVQDPRGVFDHGLAASDALVEVQALREDVVAGQVAGSLKKKSRLVRKFQHRFSFNKVLSKASLAGHVWRDIEIKLDKVQAALVV